MIDYPSGEILWSCGQQGAFGRREPTEDALFGYAHEAEMLPDGNILLFSNGNTFENKISKAKEILIDPENAIAEEIWSWDDNYYDFWGGDADRLPNENTLITHVSRGRLIEVNPDGETVWQMKISSETQPAANIYGIYQMKRVDTF